jgi:hypothetical protein
LNIRQAITALFISTSCLPTAFADTNPHPPYCAPQPEPGLTENNIAEVPQGSVNNQVQDPPGLALPEGELTPAMVIDPSGGYRSYKWSEIRWQEPALNCIWVGHEFVFVPAANYSSKTGHPTIVYFHPNGVKHIFEIDSPLYRNVVEIARNNGFNFLSVEFRHPVTDQYLAYYNNNKVFHEDVGLFTQFLRTNAAKMRVSKNNIFTFGYSRGSLALWQALRPDLGGGNTGKPSSLVSGFVGYQAQTTYSCDEYAEWFLDSLDPGTPQQVADCKAVNWWYAQFGSALDEVTFLRQVPVRLQYRQGFELLEPKDQWNIKKVTYSYLSANYEVDHYPNFGVALYRRYISENILDTMQAPLSGVTLPRQFEGWLGFVLPLLKPDAP